jgi:mRNA-degrading endonuclease toxin of MazEF toxin-antitoxin module
MPYNRGDVVLVLFPESNLRTAKRRPALVVQADNLATGLCLSERKVTRGKVSLSHCRLFS